MNDCNNNDANIMTQQAPTPLRIPTMDECVGFLEKNPTAMQIIGFLMDQQENNQDDKTTPSERVVYDTYKETGDDEDNSDIESVGSEDAPTVRRYKRLMGLDGNDIVEDYSLSNDDFGDSFKKQIPISAPATVLPLSELAFKAVSAQFKNEGELHDRKGMESLGDLEKAFWPKRDSVIHDHQTTLQESAEAAMLKFLFPLINYIKHGFLEKVKQEIDAAKSGQEQLITEAKKEAASLGLTLRASRQEIKNKQSSFVKQHASDIPSVDEGKLILCTSPTCYNLFYPNLVRRENRCHSLGCMSESRNCGCGMYSSPCRVCGYYYCKDDRQGHVKNCRPPPKRIRLHAC